MLRRRYTRWPLVVALVLSSYALVLLWSSLSSRDQLRTAADARLVADSTRGVKALADFGAQLRAVAAEAAGVHELGTYLINKALGMSAQYGLNANLDTLERRFREKVSKERAESKALIRIAFIGEDGEVLADSAPEQGPLALPREPAPSTVPTFNLAKGWIVTRTPVVFKGKPSGTVVTVSELSHVYRFLINPADGGSYRETLLTLEGEEIPRPSDSPMFSKTLAQQLVHADEGVPVRLGGLHAQGSERVHGGLVAIKATVEGLPAALVITISADELYGHLSSTIFLVSLSLFPFLVLLAYRKLEAARRDAANHATELEQTNQKLSSAMKALEAAKNELLSKNIELEDAYQHVEDLSLTDPLTGLHNRRFLLQRLDSDVALCVRRYQAWIQDPSGSQPENSDISFFLIDIDHFKQVNDVYGHAAGDAVLSQMRERLASAVRASDYMVRWGGEEFMVVARETSRELAGFMAERIRAAVASKPFDLGDGQQLTKTCSVGFASFPFLPRAPDRLNWNQVVTLADLGLYMAKRGGRDTWVGIVTTDQSLGCDVSDLFARIEADPEAAAGAGDIRIESRPVSKTQAVA